MAKLTQDDILKLAKLARLRLTETEINKLQGEIGEILEYVEVLQNVDIKGLMPTYQVTGLTNITRPDEVRDYGATPSDLLKNLPAREKNYIKTKRMIR
ncbi:Asp-tRNA(Asn)/Glu-tRNA(Gln) amidotransferase subunit GatC [Candidatus Saccharibacteria bacterium]|nr:Asp-tRNA(Asn)/Glu-tRNA(Gln) amidotransferase subunit GatC [Candidatus Saccharibacteria bacterium]